MPRVFLGLGSNQGNRIAHLRQAVSMLSDHPQINILNKSSVFQTPALMQPDAPKSWDIDFYNCCIEVETSITPLSLLTIIKNIEKKIGRKLNAPRWSPRVIDIDIIDYNNQCIQLEALRVPHVGLLERNFVLIPLLEISPYWQHPLYPDINLHQKLKAFDVLPFAPFQLDQPKIIGILNLSTNSFSGDGLKQLTEIKDKFFQLVDQGAEVIDIGAASSKPGAPSLSVEAEWEILFPVVEALGSWLNSSDLLFKPKISIDTYQSAIVKKLLDYPVDFINDIYGINTKEICQLLKNRNLKYILMHHCGPAGDKYLPIKKPAIKQLLKFFIDKKENLLAYGLCAKQIIFDIGIGFGKYPFQVQNILENLEDLSILGVGILVGHSRKASISLSIQTLSPEDRDFETAVISHKIKRSAQYLRVHNVVLTRRALCC